LPKIDLHCHLDGSVRPETVIDIAKIEGIELPTYDLTAIIKELTAPAECISLDEYLKSFNLPNLVMQSKESLKRITFELMEDSANENVKYIEIRFAPLLHTSKGLSLEDVINSVLAGIKEGEKAYEIKGNLILSCMRIMPVAKAFEVVEGGRKFLDKGVVAIDLCASEEEGFCSEFEAPIALARKYGYRVTIHAGETGIGKNVLEAIEILKAERIGHGIFIKDHEESYKIVKANGITLEMCVTSNLHTKAISSADKHPFYDFHKDGIKVTINTDNRTVSDTHMTKECKLIFNELKITKEDYKSIYLNSVQASFSDDITKIWLKSFIN
jgi:adenosine deaminase